MNPFTLGQVHRIRCGTGIPVYDTCRVNLTCTWNIIFMWDRWEEIELLCRGFLIYNQINSSEICFTNDISSILSKLYFAWMMPIKARETFIVLQVLAYNVKLSSLSLTLATTSMKETMNCFDSVLSLFMSQCLTAWMLENYIDLSRNSFKDFQFSVSYFSWWDFMYAFDNHSLRITLNSTHTHEANNKFRNFLILKSIHIIWQSFRIT